MAGPFSASVAGKACRIYKNASSDVLALDDIALMEIARQRSASGAFFSTTIIKTSRTNLYLGQMPSDRVIAKIEMIGDYESYDAVNDILTWKIEVQIITTPLQDMPQIGDTI